MISLTRFACRVTLPELMGFMTQPAFDNSALLAIDPLMLSRASMMLAVRSLRTVTMTRRWSSSSSGVSEATRSSSTQYCSSWMRIVLARTSIQNVVSLSARVSASASPSTSFPHPSISSAKDLSSRMARLWWALSGVELFSTLDHVVAETVPVATRSDSASRTAPANPSSSLITLVLSASMSRPTFTSICSRHRCICSSEC